MPLPHYRITVYPRDTMRTASAACRAPGSDECMPLALRVRCGRFWFHYSILGLILLAIIAAIALSFAFHKLGVPLKGFREGEFKPVTVVSQSISVLNFLLFLM